MNQNREKSSALSRNHLMVVLLWSVMVGIGFAACGGDDNGADESPTENTAETCVDGEDNDEDGAVDCDDAECDAICSALDTDTGTETPEEELHVYLCFGQSNMSGQSDILAEDNTVDERFLVLAAADTVARDPGEYYPATPPLAHSGAKVGPADFFGRKMVANLPEHIKVAVINVAVGGQSIKLFDPDTSADYIATAREANEWWIPYLDQYGGDMYTRMVEMGQIALETGEIKGILLHQGESDWEITTEWPGHVQHVYESLLADLGLNADDVPLLAGEMLQAEGNCCSSFNTTAIAHLSEVIPNSYIISSEGCPMVEGDEYNAHFSREGYQTLGERYADQMLELLGY